MSVSMATAMAQPRQPDYQIKVEVSGTIRATVPCKINANRPINTPFGDVEIARIGGEYKKTEISYQLDCTRAGTNALKMKVEGDGAEFNTKLLRIPSQANLGIAFKRDNTALALNAWFSFYSWTRPPKLHAILLANPDNGSIKSGEFSASATLVVDYQ
jgi:type 1 fimbria pilin